MSTSIARAIDAFNKVRHVVHKIRRTNRPRDVASDIQASEDIINAIINITIEMYKKNELETPGDLIRCACEGIIEKFLKKWDRATRTKMIFYSAFVALVAAKAGIFKVGCIEFENRINDPKPKTDDEIDAYIFTFTPKFEEKQPDSSFLHKINRVRDISQHFISLSMDDSDKKLMDEILKSKGKINEILINIPNNYRSSEIPSGPIPSPTYYIESSKTFIGHKELMEMVCKEFQEKILSKFTHGKEKQLIKVYTAFVLYTSYRLQDWFFNTEPLKLAPDFNGKGPLDITLYQTSFHSVDDIAENWNQIPS
jgi:hypothetical protein